MESKMNFEIPTFPAVVYTTHDPFHEQLADMSYRLDQKDHVLPARAENVKVLKSNVKIEKSNAKATCEGADAGGPDKPASGRINNTTPYQKSSDDSAQFQGGVESLRVGGPDLAYDTRTFGAHEGHHRIGDGDHQGRKIPDHSSGNRLEEGAEKTARAIGKTNERPRHSFGTRSGDDAALGGELVQDHIRSPEHAGVQLSFWPTDIHNHGGAQFGQGKRITKGRAGVGGSPRPQHNGKIHSGGSHNPAPIGQSNLTCQTANAGKEASHVL